MATIRWSFPDGSDGDSLTAALAGGDTTSLGGGVSTLSDDQTLIGPLSAKMTGTASGHQWWAKEGLSSTAYSIDAYVYLTTAHSGQSYIMWAGSSSSARSAGIAMTTGRLLRLIDSAGTVRWESSAIPLNTWVRVSMYVTCHASTGTVSAAWYLGYDTTPQQSSGTIGSLNTLASIDRIRLGFKAATTTATGEIFFSSWAYDPVATGFPTPYTPPAPPPPESVYVGDSAVSAIYVGDDPIDFAYVG